MTLQYLKIGGMVLAIAIVTYSFIPGVEHIKAISTMPSHSTAATQSTAKKQRKTAQSGSANTKRVQKPSIQKSKTDSAQNKQEIAPAMTLRKKQTANRSGPPSKMYGGL